MRRIAVVLVGLLLGTGGLAVPTAQAAPVDPQVELLTARLGDAGKQVFLRYQLTCPDTGQTAFLAANVSQAHDGDVDVAREFLEVQCTGSTQRARLVVPVREGRLVLGDSLIETTLNQDNEPASWRADEAVVAELRREQATPARVMSTSLAGLRETSAEPLDADIDIVSAELVAGGAGVKVVYEARCPRDYFTFVFSEVSQGNGPTGVDARGTLSAFCTGLGSWQQLVAVVSLSDGPPFAAGPAHVKGVLNNCGDATGCFLASDEQDVLLGSGTGPSRVKPGKG
jgi:hypothetical protein